MGGQESWKTEIEIEKDEEAKRKKRTIKALSTFVVLNI